MKWTEVDNMKVKQEVCLCEPAATLTHCACAGKKGSSSLTEQPVLVRIYTWSGTSFSQCGAAKAEIRASGSKSSKSIAVNP